MGPCNPKDSFLIFYDYEFLPREDKPRGTASAFKDLILNSMF